MSYSKGKYTFKLIHFKYILNDGFQRDSPNNLVMCFPDL